MARIIHDPANDGEFVELGRNRKTDLLDLFHDPENPEVGRDVTLVGPGGVRIRIREAMGHNLNPEAREIQVIVVDAVLEIPAGPTLDLRQRGVDDDTDARAFFGRWLSDFTEIAESTEWALPPLLVEGYVRHKAGDRS